MSGPAVVLSFPQGRRLEELSDPTEMESFVEDDAPIPAVDDAQKTKILERIDLLRRLVEQDRIDGLVFVAQDPLTGYFLTELCLDQDINRTELFGYMGVLDTVKLEIGEQATMAPTISLAGTIIDPYFYEDEQ